VYFGQFRTTLNRFAARFPGEVLDATSQEIDAWLRSLEVAPSTRNVLRHSFISYRIATVKSADQVALEAGNSLSIIFKHCRELTTEVLNHAPGRMAAERTQVEHQGMAAGDFLT